METALSGFRNSLSLLVGEDAELCRLELLGAPRDLPGGDVRVPAGVCAPIEAMARELSTGAVRLGRKVTLVDWSLLSNGMGKVVVEAMVNREDSGRLSGGTEVYHADYVISTIPLAVLRRCHQQLFYPGLDQQKVTNTRISSSSLTYGTNTYYVVLRMCYVSFQIDSMQRLGVGHLAKLHLEWDRCWWARGEAGLSLAWNGREIKSRRLPQDWTRFVCGFAEVEGQRALLACWVAGGAARVVDQLEDKQVEKTICTEDMTRVSR